MFQNVLEFKLHGLSMQYKTREINKTDKTLVFLQQ